MTEERSNGYQDLYQAGWNAAMDDKAAPKAQQPAAEPYAWMAVGGTIWRHKGSDDDVPLFTAPQAQPADVPLLTGEELDALCDRAVSYYQLGREVERAVRQKAGLK